MGEAKAAVALPQSRPALAGAEKLAADQLGIGHDRVGPKVLEIISLLLRGFDRCKSLKRDRSREPRAALIQQQYTILFQRSFQPTGFAVRTRRRKARSALKKHKPGEVRLVLVLDRNHLAREDRDFLRVRFFVVQRQDELVVCTDETGQPVRALSYGTPPYSMS